MVPEGVVTAVGKMAKEAEEHLLRAIEMDAVEQEPEITSRLMASMEWASEISQMEDTKVKIYTKVFSSLGRGSAESKIGADYGIVLSVESKDFQVEKGLISQAKRDRAGLRAHGAREFGVSTSGYSNVKKIRIENLQKLKELQEQAKKMLAVSPASFVTIYGRKGILIAPAIEIAGIKDVPSECICKPFQSFMKDMAICQVGDQKLVGSSMRGLGKISLLEQVPHVAEIRAVVTRGR